MVPYYHEAMHLSESQLCAAAENCPICGGTARSKLLRIQDSPDIWLLRCRKCHVCSASRMPTAETLELYYSEFYSRSGSPGGEEDKTTFDQPLRLVHRIKSGIKSSLEGRRADILDFGGGDGTVSFMLGKTLLKENACEEVRTVLVDMSGEVPRSDTSRIVVEKRDRLEDDGQQYDIVIASAILEHIPYPTEVLRDLLCSLRTGGVFYARTPYLVPLLRLLPLRLLRRRLFYPAHVHDMGQRFWENILSELGLSAEFRMLRSTPSVVEITFRNGFFRALASHLLKAPWYVLGRRYGLVGGWEVIIQRFS